MADRLNIAALAWCLPGFLFQCFGLFAGVVPLGIVGTVFLVLGLAHYVRGKGYATGWALWGIVPIMGPLLLILQPAQSGITRYPRAGDAPAGEVLDDILIKEDPEIHPSPPQKRKRVFGGIFLLAAMIPIGLFLVLMSPSLPYIAKYSSHVVSSKPDPAGEAPRAAVPIPGEPETAPAAPQETPAEPAPTPNPQSVAASTPSATKAVPSSPGAKTTPFETQFKQLHEGMTYEEVVKVVGDNSVLVTDGRGATKLVKWVFPDGSFFTAKFQNDVLERTTPFHAPRKKEPARAIPQASRQEAAATANTTEDDSMEADTQEEGDFLSQMYAQMYEEKAEEELAAPTGRVVRVSQTPRNAGRSDLKKAQLPRFSKQIERGPHDVNISNTFSYDVKVGLRTGNKRGKNFSIPADGTATVYLPNDTYDLYYIDADNPDTLEHSGSFTVASPPFSIFLNLR